jgi:hypothetical protein
MLNLLDILLRDLFVAQIPTLASDTQVTFQPPDSALKADVVNIGKMVLDVYLVDLRENRQLRHNHQTRSVSNGVVYATPAPPQVNCHFLISAWSPTQPSPGVEPTLDEHALLYQAMAVLEEAMPLNPSNVYAPGSAPLLLWPTGYQNMEMWTIAMPPETCPYYCEFWQSMGHESRWKPCIYLIVTLPVVMSQVQLGPMVTTRITDYLHSGVATSVETLIQIAASVLDSTHPLPGGLPSPVVGAWVQLESTLGVVMQSATTDTGGHFTFEFLAAGNYQLRTGAVGLGTVVRAVTVPSETGEYDLLFT